MKRRIAGALFNADSSSDGVPEYAELAEAVLSVMSEPTDHMIASATDLGPNATLRDQWRAMIEAAKQ